MVNLKSLFIVVIEGKQLRQNPHYIGSHLTCLRNYFHGHWSSLHRASPPFTLLSFVYLGTATRQPDLFLSDGLWFNLWLQSQWNPGERHHFEVRRLNETYSVDSIHPYSHGDVLMAATGSIEQAKRRAQQLTDDIGWERSPVITLLGLKSSQDWLRFLNAPWIWCPGKKNVYCRCSSRYVFEYEWFLVELNELGSGELCSIQNSTTWSNSGRTGIFETAI